MTRTAEVVEYSGGTFQRMATTVWDRIHGRWGAGWWMLSPEMQRVAAAGEVALYVNEWGDANRVLAVDVQRLTRLVVDLLAKPRAA